MDKNEKHIRSPSGEGELETIQARGRELHLTLFPEEYDHIYDSISEAHDRQIGKNPMNAEYVVKSNALRAQLGFMPFNVGRDAYNDDTYAWVLEKLRQGKETELREIITNRTHATLETELKRKQELKRLHTHSWLDQKIDDMLVGDEFIYDGQDRVDPQIIGFRIMGELFNMKHPDEDGVEFFRQIKRILPGRPDTDYPIIYRQAMNDWMEAYGFE